MEKEHVEHCNENISVFANDYFRKYAKGQEQHKGSMWTMGAYQALENAEEEALDNWSYLRQIRKTLDEIREEVLDYMRSEGKHPVINMNNIEKILNRRKED